MERPSSPSPKRGPYKKTKSSSEVRSFDPFRGLSKEVNEACDAWLRKKGMISKQWTSGGFSNKSGA